MLTEARRVMADTRVQCDEKVAVDFHRRARYQTSGEIPFMR